MNKTTGNSPWGAYAMRCMLHALLQEQYIKALDEQIKNSEHVCLYVINGTLKDERHLQLSLVQSPVYLGGRTGGYEGQYFDGIISDAMIFKRALTAAEVETLYTAQQ